MKPSETALGHRGPVLSTVALALVLLLLLPSVVLGADWPSGERVTSHRGSRLDSLHQLASGDAAMHLVYARLGPNRIDDRMAYQRSTDRGLTWSKERSLFGSTATYRQLIPNLALAASGRLVVVAWRVIGEEKTTLLVRTSADGGQTFGELRVLAQAKRSSGIGVPAVAIGDDFIAVAWTNRVSGKVSVRTSRDVGRRFRPTETLAATSLSIDCKAKVTDGLVGIAAVGRRVHVAWSHARKRSCLADAVKLRTSADRGKSWNRVRTITERSSYGWPELAARGDTVVATVQSPGGGLITARSAQNGRNWSDAIIKPPKGYSLSASDVVLLPRQKAMITYVAEHLRKAKLIETRVVARPSRSDGKKYGAPQSVTNTASSLRMAPNIAATGSWVVIVFQSGPLDASRRNLYATHQR